MSDDSDSGTWQSLCQIPGTSYKIDDLHPGATYMFAIRAQSTCGWGKPGRTLRVTMLAAPPSKPPSCPRVHSCRAREEQGAVRFTVILQWKPPLETYSLPILEHELSMQSSVTDWTPVVSVNVDLEGHGKDDGAVASSFISVSISIIIFRRH